MAAFIQHYLGLRPFIYTYDWNRLLADDDSIVLEVKIIDYADKCMIHWDNGISMYKVGIDDNVKYDIIFHIPDIMDKHYRLFQIEEIYDAEEKFLFLQDKFLPFLDIAAAKEMLTINGIQSILDVLNLNPAWTLAHLSAYFNLHDTFDYNSVSMDLDTPDESTGMTPLHIAVTRLNVQSVESLVKKKCSLYHKDLQDNNVFHHAAFTKNEILNVLLPDARPFFLNMKNKLGYTPVHLACKSENYESLQTLILAGGEVNIPCCRNTENNNCYTSLIHVYLEEDPNFLNGRAIKYGGTPLHWSKSPQEINQLINHQCYINAVDFKNRTALHIMVLNANFDCIIALLSKGADTNIQDCDGNTPLHLAAYISDNLHILHSLIIFGADLNILNNEGESARHLVAARNNLQALYCLHAVGAERCNSMNDSCCDGCSAYGCEDGEAPPDIEGPANSEVLNNMLDVAGMEMVINKHRNGMPKKGRLLSLDGGGIRGLILIQMLLELETVIGKPINHCFDWIAGTSTGGILALGLASGKTARECLGMYFHYKDRMFPGLRPYPSKPLEEVLQEMLGSDTYMRDITYPKLIIPCAVANRQPIELFLYRNYESPNELLKKTKRENDTLLWEIARSTSAAPTYFRPFNNLIDGGLIANNPTLDALTEIEQYNLALRACKRENEQCPVSIVISLGTGLVPVKDTRQFPDGLPDVLKILCEAPGLLSILIDQATATNGRVIERARAWCASVGIPYFRFNPQMSEDVGLNEKCSFKLCRTLWETKVYMHANMQKIKEVAHLLNEI